MQLIAPANQQAARADCGALIAGADMPGPANAPGLSSGAQCPRPQQRHRSSAHGRAIAVQSQRTLSGDVEKAWFSQQAPSKTQEIRSEIIEKSLAESNFQTIRERLTTLTRFTYT